MADRDSFAMRIANLDARPSAELLAWVEESLGHGTSAVGWKRLTGGLTSIVHEVTVARNGRHENYVLRWWPSDNEWADWNARAVILETAVLNELAGSNIPIPSVIASTANEVLGSPAILMARLPGRILLTPHDRDAWLRQMAQMLVRIHAVTAVDCKPFESWLDRAQLWPPPDASRPQVWTEAIAFLADERAPSRTCFLHRDYQHFNMLWSEERLTGVVDWSEACVGPPDIDVGHCRLNLAVLFSADVADRFQEMYEAESGQRVDTWWDVHALLSYGPSWRTFVPMQVHGRAPVDVDGMTGRVEEVLDRALRRR
jgi:aminoglycoside phosphotransferase (APT) family kinase protein